MKTLLFSLTPVLLSATLSAQGVFSNKTQSVLEKVIQDYPNHFLNIKGDLIAQSRQAAEYKSTLQLPGSSSCIVTLSKAVPGDGYSWVCAVAGADNFEQAKVRYKEIFNQIGNSIIATTRYKKYILSGQYEEPVEDRKASRIVFTLLPGVAEVKKLKVELILMQEESGKWQILLSVNDQEKDPAQGGITAG